MRILQLCIRVPFPPVDGGSIAMYNIQRGLFDNGAILKVLAFNTVKQFVDLEKLDDNYKAMTRIEGLYLDNRIKPLDAFVNLFSGDSYHIVRFIRRDFEELLIRVLKEEEFDVIQLESLFMVPYINTIRQYTKATIALRTHNIEHLIWQRMADSENRSLRKWYLKLLAKRLKKYETIALNHVDAIIPLTNEDANTMKEMGAKVPIFIAPIGINFSEYHPQPMPDKKILFHIGAMDWLPNQEGIKWFLDEVWPSIKTSFPDVQLRFAGKKMPKGFFKYADERCEVKDYVEDAKLFMADGQIMIVPLFSGSGMRVKILEGMAMGKAIITTPIGAEGIPAIDGKQLVLAKDANEFISKLGELLSNEGKVEELGKNALELAKSLFDNRLIGLHLLDFYKNLKKID